MRNFVALALLCAATCVVASPESESLTRRARDALEAQRYEDAAKLLVDAVRADPADRVAVFYLGATANRLGRAARAHALLAKAEADGLKDPELDFEMAWSLMELGEAAQCDERLQRYEKANPGRALASEFQGRCLLALGRYTDAEAKLREALARDASSKPRVDLLIARVQYARGDRRAAAATLAEASFGSSDVGRALRDGQAALAALAPPPGTGLKFAASAAVGHNSNVIGLGNTIPLPADITGKSSAFVRTSFGVSNTVQIDSQTRGSVGYGLLLDRYLDIRAANLDDHYLYAEIAHRRSERLTLSMRGSMQITYLDGAHFRTQPAVRAAAAYRFTPNSVTEASYVFAEPEYAVNANVPAFDRNGDIHALSLNHVMRVPDSPWSGSIGYAHVENRAEGSDFRSTGDAASAAVRYAFTTQTDLTVGANFGRDRYRNSNSLTGFARRDKPQSGFVQINGPLAEHLRYYVQIQASRSGSNISFYDYRQHTLLGGIAVDF